MMKNIKKNKIKFVIIIVIMILILILGIIAVLYPAKYTSFVFHNGLIIFTLGIMGVFVSMYCIFEFAKKLFDKNAMVFIDNKGVIDKVNILDYPFINWKDTLKIEECNINNIPHLKVFINNPQEYINQKKGFKKWILNHNYKKYQTPILLNSIYLSCSFDNYKKNILTSYKEYKLSTLH
ncbi:STM3941 family protein [Chryseobacterium indologenes]|uniref:Uncharacterized protein n=1 Tax=Chryseobacterium indologenes TaxID=253 RepID=A0A0N0ZT42_CHRID|nr:STM3941 family protein [Chryseobacterium indologenes]KPE48939.1 hypothetical protein AOB46_22695 [Chryseobacterium indologenes]